MARKLEIAWECKMQRIEGAMGQVDYYRYNLAGVLTAACEFKDRSVGGNAYATYPSVYMALRKWVALQLISMALDPLGLFVVQYTDCLCWVDVNEIGVTKVIRGGRYDRPGVENDVEPIIEVPVTKLHVI